MTTLTPSRPAAAEPGIGDQPWQALFAWGATVDHRVALTADDARALGLDSRDEEFRVSPARFRALLERAQRAASRPAEVAAGGSPFISALALAQLRATEPWLPLPRFWGAYPPALVPLAGPLAQEGLLELAIPAQSILGTLCLEDRERSVKHLFSVFHGRRLTLALAHQMIERLGRLGSQPAVLAVGGLNKAHPAALEALIRAFRAAAAPGSLVVVTTNSFRPVLAHPARERLMAAYLRVLRAADVVSLSAEEAVDLGRWAGLGARAGAGVALGGLGLPGMAVCHNRAGCIVHLPRPLARAMDEELAFSLVRRASAGVVGYLYTGKASLAEPSGWPEEDPASAEEFRAVFGMSPWARGAVPIPRSVAGTAHAVTGLGSRFDAYLTALLPSIAAPIAEGYALRGAL